jgi:hypothetical protein
MNEAHDHLEAELAALRPQDASLELRRRIADHRAHSSPSSFRWRLAFALAGGLAAACLAAFILQWGSGWRIDLERTSVASRKASKPNHQVTYQPGDSATIAARPGSQMPPYGSEPPRFSWPLDNTLTSMIPPDLLE